MTGIDCPATDIGVRVLRSGKSNPMPLPVVLHQGAPSTGATSTTIIGDTTSPDVNSGAEYALKTFCEHAYSYMIFCSPSRGNLSRTRLGLAIGIPLGVILLLGLAAFAIVRRHRRRQSGFVQGPRILPMSQHLSIGAGRGTSKQLIPAPTAPTAPTPSTAPSAEPSSPDLGSPAVSVFGAPPPYTSPS